MASDELVALLEGIEAGNEDHAEWDVSRLQEVLGTLVAAFVVPSEELSKETGTVAKFISHLTNNFPDVFIKATDCGCGLKLLQRLLELHAGLDESPESSLEMAISDLCNTWKDVGDQKMFMFAKDMLLLTEDLGSILELQSEDMNSSSAVISAFESSLSHECQKTNRLCSSLRQESELLRGKEIQAMQISLKASRLENFSCLVLDVLAKIFASKQQISGHLITPRTFDIIGNFLYSCGLRLKKACFDLFGNCISCVKDYLIPHEELLSSIVMVASYTCGRRHPDLDCSMAKCLVNLNLTSSAFGVAALVNHSSQVFQLLPSVLLQGTTELQEVLVQLATHLAPLQQHLHATMVRSLLSASSLLTEQSVKLAAQMLCAIYLARLQMKRDGEIYDSAQAYPSESEGVLVPFAQVSDWVRPSGGDDPLLSGKLRALSLLAEVAFTVGDAKLLNPVTSAISSWMSFLLAVENQADTFRHSRQSLLMVLARAASCGPSVWQSECQAMDLLLDFLLQSWALSSGNATAAQNDGESRGHALKVMVLQVIPVGFPERSSMVLAAMEDGDWLVRRSAIEALDSLHLEAATIPALCSALRNASDDPEEGVRLALAQRVGVLACRSVHVVPQPLSAHDNTPERQCETCGRSTKVSLFFPGWDLPKELEDGPAAVINSLWEICLKLLHAKQGLSVRQAVLMHMPALVSHVESQRMVSSAQFELMNTELTEAMRDPSAEIRGSAFGLLPDWFKLTAASGDRPGFSPSDQSSEEEPPHVLLNMLKPIRDKLAQRSVLTEEKLRALEAAGEIVVHAENVGRLRLFAILVLVDALTSEIHQVQAGAISKIKEVARRVFPNEADARTAVRQLVSPFSQDFYQFLGLRLRKGKHVFRLFAEAVLEVDCHAFAREITPVVLQWCLVKIGAAADDGQFTPTSCTFEEVDQERKDAEGVLEELAGIHEMELPVFLACFAVEALTVVLVDQSPADSQRVFVFVEHHVGRKIQDLIFSTFPQLVHSLIWFLGDESNPRAIRRASRVGPMIELLKKAAATSSENLQPPELDVLGILNHLDRKYQRSKSTEEKRHVLRCFGGFSELLGEHLAAFAPKFLAILAGGMAKPQLRSTAAASCLRFTQRLAQASVSSLRIYARQIAVALLPCLEVSESPGNAKQASQEESRKRSREDAAADALSLSQMAATHKPGDELEGTLYPDLATAVAILELIVQRKSELLEALKDFPPLPNLNALSRVNQVLRDVKGSLSLHDHLEVGVRGLKHQSIHVRANAAEKLKDILELYAVSTMDMVKGDVLRDQELVSRLVLALLNGCTVESDDIPAVLLRLKCMECLGTLGAIDPGRLMAQEQLQVAPSLILDDDILAEVLIKKHLAKDLVAMSGPDLHDKAAFAIQEILRMFGCGPDVATGGAHSSATGVKLWNSFDDNTQEIISPCLNSKFTLGSGQHPTSSQPLFAPEQSFGEWMYRWLKRLTHQAQGRLQAMTLACRGVLRNDMTAAQFLLPLVVLDVLRHGSPHERSSIMMEALAVLRHVGQAGQAGDMKHHTVVQEVFSLVDAMEGWVVDATQTLSTVRQARSNRRPPSSAVLETSVARSLNLSGDGWNSGDTLQKADDQCTRVGELLSGIPRSLLAATALASGADARALRYMEDDVRGQGGAYNPASGQEWQGIPEQTGSAMLQAFYRLGDGDGVVGVAAISDRQTVRDPEEQILIHEASGRWSDALACYEQGLQATADSPGLNTGFLSCLLRVGHLQAVLTQVDGLLVRLPSLSQNWKAYGVEAAWRLGHWEQLDAFLLEGDDQTLEQEDPGTEHSVDVLPRLAGSSSLSMCPGVGKAFSALQEASSEAFTSVLHQARVAIMRPLEAAAMESYDRAYPSLVHLHMLRTLEEYAISTSRTPSVEVRADIVKGFGTLWHKRLQVAEANPLVWEPILAAERTLYGLASVPEEINTCWLQYAKICRKSGHHELATRAVLQAKLLNDPRASIEQAKLHWSTGSTYQAISVLQDVLRAAPVEFLGSESVKAAVLGSLVPGVNRVASQGGNAEEESSNVARSLLLLARWSHATGQRPKAQLLEIFGQVKQLQPKWDKGFFCLAKYLDDLMQDAKKRQDDGTSNLVLTSSANKARGSSSSGPSTSLLEDDKPWWTYVGETMANYAHALRLGNRSLFEALPRLLTLWFEFGSRIGSEGIKKASPQLKAENSKVQKVIQECKSVLPVYLWLTSLPQLVSRICHSNPEVKATLKGLLVHVIGLHPQQALWYFVVISKSAVSARKDAATDVLNAVKNAAKKTDKKAIYNQFAGFVDQIVRLSFHGSGSSAQQQKIKALSISADFAALKRMMPLPVLVPSQRALTVSLPPSGTDDPGHDPFPASEAVLIDGMADGVDVLQSLQRPKKVEFIGSDGKLYPFLCKPKDDLRKDARMMEFTSVLNRVLARHEASRTRKLYIRTFAVLPLTEDCGMVEWVANTRGFRHILQDLYAACGKFDKMKTLPSVKRIYDTCTAEGISPAVTLQSKILPLFPPIFHQWFLHRYSEPSSWLQGRRTFCNTAAVWSMVGHIVGLGDRHGENVLIDAVSGDCVHVDFSCLFDKGLTLNQPEVVPFRLTQNMVDALGVCGFEGAFRRVSEISLKVLRSRRGALMSILETFLYDPLVEWSKGGRGGISSSPIPTSNAAESCHPAAQKALYNIDCRLQGVVVGVGAAPSLPMSVEGQANHLILEATSLENLGKMYIWWMPWF